MYRLWRHRLCRSALHNKNFCSPLLFTATKTKYASEKEIVEESRCAQVSDYLTLIFLLSNNNRDWSVIFLSLPYRMTSSSPFNCETPNLILKVMNRQENDFFQKLEHSLFSEIAGIGLNSCFKKIWQFLNCSLPFLYSDVRSARTWRSHRYFAELFRPNNLAN